MKQDGRSFRRNKTERNTKSQMATLPLCKQVLKLHTMQANHIAYIWRNSRQVIITYFEWMACNRRNLVAGKQTILKFSFLTTKKINMNTEVKLILTMKKIII